MEALYLRHRDGTALGPLTRAAFEVLWDAHVIDASTPISKDGSAFAPIRQHADVYAHLEEVRSRLLQGEDPWPDAVEVWARPAPEPAKAPTTGTGPDGRRRTTLALLLEHAVQRLQGVLTLPTGEPSEGAAQGTVRLWLRDGRIVVVETDDPDLSLGRWLVETSVVDERQVEAARSRAESMGGDLGGALVAVGALPPNVYFEKLIAWATVTVGRCLLRPLEQPTFETCEVKAPAIPLGFDRFGLLFEALREVADRATLEKRLLPKRSRPLIPSLVDGVTIEDTKPKPRELRVLNAINGAQTLGDLLDELGGGDERSRDVLRAVLFATEAGFVVFGQDPNLERDLAEVRQLEAVLADLEEKTLFEVFEVSEKSTDEEVRSRYTDLAKKYHPDGLRSDAAPELRAVRDKLFAFVSEGFERLETSDLRYQYALDLEAGRAGASSERARVEAALEAETMFKKAEILLRMKKYGEALEHVERALRLAPGDDEFKIFRAYAAYLESARTHQGPSPAHSAIKEISDILKSEANIARGYLYLGYLHKAIDRPEVALRNFRKVLEYDSRHPEAVREVRLAQARKERGAKKGRWGL